MDFTLLLREVQLGNVVDVFDAAVLADSEIAAAQARHPHKAEALWNSFRLLQPNSALLRTHPKVIRAHMRELLERVAYDEDTRPATRPEIMMGFAHACMAAPITPDAQALYTRLALEVFGDNLFKGGYDAAYTERWPGELDQLEADLRERLAVKDRVLPPRDRWFQLVETATEPEQLALL